jgi:hypothetical protein
MPGTKWAGVESMRLPIGVELSAERDAGHIVQVSAMRIWTSVIAPRGPMGVN